MSVIDEVVAANQTYARSFNLGHLPMPPARKLAVVACMDARLTIEPMLGLKTGEAHIIRNAGGLITEDALRSLVISHHLLGTREVLIINHTDCGMLTFRDEDLRERLRKETGAAPETPRRFYAFSDIEENVRRQIRAAREHSWIPAGITIRGFVYELRTGWVNGKLVGALRLCSIRCQKQPGILIAASLWSTIRTETSTSITNT